MTGEPMAIGRGRVVLAVALPCVAVFAFAFVAAPRSCEWGLVAYLWTGVALLAWLFAVPFLLGADRRLRRRITLGLGWAALGGAVWVAGLFVANVRIMCRLF